MPDLPDLPDLIVPRRALVSTSDREGLAALARALAGRGVSLVSTGGTARALSEAGLAVEEVAQVTGAPEMMGGRVKTLHPRIHGAILARRGRDAAEMAAHGIAGIDLVIVNLYPFEAALARGEGDLVERIDVGGPAMIRAAAKNHAWVAVASDPQDYVAILADLDAHGATRLATRRSLAARAFARVSAYDAAIAGWMARGEEAPPARAWGGRRLAVPRYGENPHQAAALYARPDEARPGVATARQIQGGALSYNNLLDADAAWEAVAQIAATARAGGRPASIPAADPAADPACVIVKHANPCGAALGASAAEAFERAREADPDSAYGGIVAVSVPVDEALAEAVARLFAEVLIAPGIEDAARARLAGRARLRVLLGPLPDPAGPGEVLRSIGGGLLVQSRDAGSVGPGDLRVVTRRAPEPCEVADMLFAWSLAKHVRSNAIVLARGGRTLGVGPGQTSRVGAVEIALAKARAMAERTGGEGARGAALASDAFFPFPDGLEAAARAGVRAVIQPGGSMRDEAVIAAADAQGVAMAFTGLRHFRH